MTTPGCRTVLALAGVLLLGTASAAHADEPAPSAADWVRRLASEREQDGPACEALVRLGVAAVEPLRLALMDGNVEQRRAAARVLGRLGPVAAPALPALVATLEDEEAPVRAEAATAIESVGWPEGNALATLAAKREDPDENVRRIALPAAILTGRLDGSAVARLLGEHEARSAMGGALRVLGPKALPLLTDLLAAESWQARAVAAERLGDLGKVALPAASALARATTDESRTVADAALRALYATGDGSDAARAVYLAMAASTEAWKRSSGVLVLSESQFDGAAATAAIDRAQADPDPSVRLAAAIARLTRGRSNEAAVAQCVQALAASAVTPPYPMGREHRNLRAGGRTLPSLPALGTDGVLAALRLSGSEAAVAAVVVALEGSKGEHRKNLTRALGRLLPSSSATHLVRVLSDADADVRLEAALCLSRTPEQTRAVLPVLLARLRDDDDLVRGTLAVWGRGEAIRSALVSLGAIAAEGLASELDAIRAASPARGPYVGLNAGYVLAVLKEIGPTAGSAIPAVERLLADSAWESLKMEAEEALAAIRKER